MIMQEQQMPIGRQAGLFSYTLAASRPLDAPAGVRARSARPWQSGIRWLGLGAVVAMAFGLLTALLLALWAAMAYGVVALFPSEPTLIVYGPICLLVAGLGLGECRRTGSKLYLAGLLPLGALGLSMI
jgi:hypothetical protein